MQAAGHLCCLGRRGRGSASCAFTALRVVSAAAAPLSRPRAQASSKSRSEVYSLCLDEVQTRMPSVARADNQSLLLGARKQ